MKKIVFKRESSLKCSGDTPQKKKERKEKNQVIIYLRDFQNNSIYAYQINYHSYYGNNCIYDQKLLSQRSFESLASTFLRTLIRKTIK